MRNKKNMITFTPIERTAIMRKAIENCEKLFGKCKYWQNATEEERGRRVIEEYHEIINKLLYIKANGGEITWKEIDHVNGL